MKRHHYHPDLDFTPERLYNAAEKKVSPCSRCGALNPALFSTYMKQRCVSCGKRAWPFRTFNTVVFLLYLLSVVIGIGCEAVSPGKLDEVFGWSIHNKKNNTYREGIIFLFLGGSFILMILVMMCYMTPVFRNERRALRKRLDELGIWYSAEPENLRSSRRSPPFTGFWRTGSEVLPFMSMDYRSVRMMCFCRRMCGRFGKKYKRSPAGKRRDKNEKKTSAWQEAEACPAKGQGSTYLVERLE